MILNFEVLNVADNMMYNSISRGANNNVPRIDSVVTTPMSFNIVKAQN